MPVAACEITSETAKAFVAFDKVIGLLIATDVILLLINLACALALVPAIVREGLVVNVELPKFRPFKSKVPPAPIVKLPLPIGELVVAIVGVGLPARLATASEFAIYCRGRCESRRRFINSGCSLWFTGISGIRAAIHQ